MDLSGSILCGFKTVLLQINCCQGNLHLYINIHVCQSMRNIASGVSHTIILSHSGVRLGFAQDGFELCGIDLKNFYFLKILKKMSCNHNKWREFVCMSNIHTTISGLKFRFLDNFLRTGAAHPLPDFSGCGRTRSNGNPDIHSSSR